MKEAAHVCENETRKHTQSSRRQNNLYKKIRMQKKKIRWRLYLLKKNLKLKWLETDSVKPQKTKESERNEKSDFKITQFPGKFDRIRTLATDPTNRLIGGISKKLLNQ